MSIWVRPLHFTVISQDAQLMESVIASSVRITSNHALYCAEKLWKEWWECNFILALALAKKTEVHLKFIWLNVILLTFIHAMEMYLLGLTPGLCPLLEFLFLCSVVIVTEHINTKNNDYNMLLQKFFLLIEVFIHTAPFAHPLGSPNNIGLGSGHAHKRRRIRGKKRE